MGSGKTYREYQGTYPVIFISLKDVKCNSWDETYNLLYAIIRNEYARHKELLNGLTFDSNSKDYFNNILSGNADKSDVTLSLLTLSEMLALHYKSSAVIIIDEYDTPIESGHTNGCKRQLNLPE